MFNNKKINTKFAPLKIRKISLLGCHLIVFENQI